MTTAKPSPPEKPCPHCARSLSAVQRGKHCPPTNKHPPPHLHVDPVRLSSRHRPPHQQPHPPLPRRPTSRVEMREEGDGMTSQKLTPVHEPSELRGGETLEFRFKGGLPHRGIYDNWTRMCDGMYIVLPKRTDWHIGISDVRRVEADA